MINPSGINWTDQELVKRVLDGDKRAFGIIVQNTERLVAGIIHKMIDLSSERKDLAQDIYLKVYQKLPTFRFQSRLSTWVAQIGYNTCLDYLRKKKLPVTGDIESIPDSTDVAINGEQVFSKERAQLLRAAIDKLPPISRTLIILYHTEDLSYEEIGQVVQLPQGTVKSYLFRARKALKDQLLLEYKEEEL